MPVYNRISAHAALLAAALCISAPLRAEGPAPVPLDVPLLDAPYNTARSSRNWPSMAQSTRLGKSAYQLVHYAAGKHLDPYAGGIDGFLSILGFVALDLIFVYVPFGEAWVHEEYHRAVMGARGVDSFDEIYTFPFGADLVAVSHVRDEDLIRLKRDHPADMVRLPAAGAEGQNQLILALERDAFFLGARQYHGALFWMSYFNSYFYVSSGPEKATDELTDELNGKESTIKERDFVGHDFSSWVYDLHRPDEPYEARGTHPSGTGLDRYRRASDLTPGERRYLALQGKLYLLNFVDPFLFGVHDFDGRWNASLRHDLTAFGSATSANVFYKEDALKLFATLTNYRNQPLSTYGVDTHWLDAVAVGGVSASLRANFWQQPRRLRYDDAAASGGGLLGVRLDKQLSQPMTIYLEIDGKTRGWVAGNQYLDKNLSLRTGLTASLF